jgi:hypothetical protein
MSPPDSAYTSRQRSRISGEIKSPPSIATVRSKARFAFSTHGFKNDDVGAARFAEDTDKVLGGRGDDTINTADGDPLDAIGCGRGRDVAIFDPGDVVKGSCENTTATTTTTTTTTTGGPGPPAAGR